MGLLDFFRSRKVDEEPIREVSFTDAVLLLEARVKDDDVAIDEVKSEIGGRIVTFVSDLRERIVVLDLIDLEKKREHERTKFMTMRGLKEYIEELNRFVGNLGKVDGGLEFSLYVRDVNSAVDSFLKSSRKKLGRATILIGKELAETEELIRVFHKDVNVIIGRSSGIVSRGGKAGELRVLKESVVKVKRERDEVEKVIFDLNREREMIMNEKNEKEKEFDLFEKGDEYRNWLDEKEALKGEGEALEKSIRELRVRVNIKLLMNKFHGVPRSLELLKSYRDDFLNALMSDEGFRILDMIEKDDKEIVGKALKDVVEKSKYLKAEEVRYKTNKKRGILMSDLERVSCRVEDISKEMEMENKKLTKVVGDERGLLGEEVEIIEGILGNVKVLDEAKRLNS
jgi:hypothetical protein